MSSLPMSLGFIGGAFHSAVGNAHWVASQMDHQWALVAGCFSRSSSSNQETALAYGVSSDRVYAQWPEMLVQEKHRLDAIVVLTPTPSHYEIVMACLKAGFPVICEKALALSSAEIRQIVEVRNAVNGFLAVTFNYSGYPMVRELRSLIRKGVLGKILHFQAEMPQEGYVRVDAQGSKPAPQAWRLSDAPIPTLHLDLGVHLHHLIHYLTGQKPLKVVSDQDSRGWFPVIDNVTCLCRYSEGIQGQFWFSKSAMGHRNGLRLRIYGSEASAEWLQANPEEVLLSFADGRRQIMDRAAAAEVAGLRRYNRFKVGHPAGFIEAYGHLYTDIAGCVRQYKATGHWESEEVFGAELAFESSQLCEAMVLSTHSGSWQTLSRDISNDAPQFDLSRVLCSWNQVSAEVRQRVEAFASPEGVGRRYALGRNEHSAALSKVIELDAFVDDFVEPGTVWNGRPVVRGVDVPPHGIVVNCSMSISPVSAARRLAGLNIAGVLGFSDLCRVPPECLCLPDFIVQTRQDLELNPARWKLLAESLKDAQSRLVLDDLLRFRTTGECSVMDEYSVRFRDQYFEDFLGLTSGEVFVDGGGFDGDTTEEFCARYPDYRKVLLFEPSAATIAKARYRLRNHHSIEFIEKGLAATIETLRFNADEGSASAICESGTSQIHVTTLDFQVQEKVSFIKMDLEGWELSALAGSKRHILEDHPTLAIAVYHHPSHFWQVFDFVMGLRPDYDVYLRHYTEGWSETVMYFVPSA